MRPFAVLIDCNHSEACAESFIGPALMTGARVILFRSPRAGGAIPEGVARLELPTLALPADAARLALVLDG